VGLVGETRLFWGSEFFEVSGAMDDTNLTSCGIRLTATQFESLLRRLHPNRESAGEKYEDIRWQLTKFFEWNSGFQAEDLVDETLDRVARRLEELEIPDVVSFAWGVARNVKHEATRKAARMVPIPDRPDEAGFPIETRNAEDHIHEKMEFEQRRKCLHGCIQRLSPEDRKLFHAYYHAEGDSIEFRQKLANSLGLTMNALRVRVNRLRDKVEKCTDKYAVSFAPKKAAYFVRKSST
jgi:RNA polymerase sigma factor (sigma-70 family)